MAATVLYVSGKLLPLGSTSLNGWRLYNLYGLALASDFPFTSRLPPDVGLPDLTFTCAGTPPTPGNVPKPAYASRLLNARGESTCSFYRLGNFDLLRYPEVGDFYLGPDRIVCHPIDLRMTEVYLLSSVLSCWLERAGVPCLHASAVVVDGDTVGFLSFNGGGKSSLAAAMVQGGCSLLTDDVLAVGSGPGGFSARRGYAQMRLWPTEAEHFWGPADQLPRVHPTVAKVRVPVDVFDARERPLTCFYLPARRPTGCADDSVEIKALSPRDTVIEFVRHSFVAPLAEAVGWQPRRLDIFARLAAEVPVKHLIYPSGLDQLPRVREAILNDLQDG